MAHNNRERPETSGKFDTAVRATSVAERRPLKVLSLSLSLSLSLPLSRFQSNSARELPSPEGSATINVLSSIRNFQLRLHLSVSATSTPIKRRQTVAEIRAIASVMIALGLAINTRVKGV